MFCFAACQKTWRLAIGKTEDAQGLPLYDRNGKLIDISYFQTKRDKLMKALAIISNLIGGAWVALYIFFFSKLADEMSGGHTAMSWKGWVAMMAFATLMFGLFVGLATLLCEWSAERQLLKIRQQFLHEVMRQDIGYFDAYDATALASKLVENTRCVRNLIGIRSATAYMYIGLIISCLREAFATNWQVALISLCVVPVIVFAGWWAGNVENRAIRRVRQSNEEADSVALESLESVRTVKAFNLQRNMTNRYMRAIEEAEKTTNSASIRIGFGYGIYWMLMFCSSAFGFWYGALYLKQRNDAGCGTKDGECPTAGNVIGTFVNVLICAYFIGKVLPWFSDIRAANMAVRETVALYSRETHVDPFDESGITDFSQVNGEIEIKNVSFEYPTRVGIPVFRNLNLRIPSGKSMALVGASGCGKSTIIQLLLRFYNPDGGEILLNGLNLTEYNVRALRENIAWVSQEPKLFAISIAENIRIGKPDATQAEIEQVCKRANAHDFISALPEKYETWVGEGGGQLSGGQKQRVAIARALIKKPKILILDEATSALDNQSEKMVQETIDSIVQEAGITTIIIAHRLSTVRKANQIAVLNQLPEGGAVVAELGTHEELSAIPNGIYAALVAVQSAGFDEEDGGDGPEEIVPVQHTGTYEEQTLMQSLSKRSSSKKQMSRVLSKNEGDFIRFGSRDGPGHSSRIDPDLAAGPIMRTSSLIFNPSYTPPRLYTRSGTPLKRRSWELLLGILGGVLYNLTWPIYGIFLASFLRTYVIFASTDDLMSNALKNSLKMVGIGLAAFFGFWMMKVFGTRAGQCIVSSTRTKTYKSIVGQEMGFFDQEHRSPSRLATILSIDAGLLGEWIAGNMILWISTAVSLIVGICVCMGANAKLGAVALAIVVLLVPVAYVGSTLVTSGGSLKFWKGGVDKLSVLTSDLAHQVTDVVLNIRMVTAYNMQNAAEVDFSNNVHTIFEVGRRRAYLAGAASGLINLLRLGSFTLVFYYGAKLVSQNEMDGDIMIKGALSLLLAALQTGRTLAGSVPWALGKTAAKSTWTVIDRQPLIDEQPNALGDQLQSIENVGFNRVQFKYPTRPNLTVFRNVSFDIPRGKSVALVGASGCGKSTSVQLVERFYDTEGITFNGIDIKSYNLYNLRRKIGYVPQEPKLFSGTIRENIMHGNPEATEADVVRACEQANAWGFIQDQPQGLDTEVGRGGMRLSGGQKQRIAIARALVRSPELLILDEATSALDAESEKIVQQALNKLLATKQFTSLVIAHRLSTIRDCDIIVVFVNNAARGSQIAEVGTHHELMKIKNGVYHGLVRIAEGR